MADPQIRYDEPSDTLHIAFAPGEGAMGIELSDDILLRVNAPERRVVGLTLFNYSVLAQQTELGPRSFPLTGLSELGPDLRSLVLALVEAAP